MKTHTKQILHFLWIVLFLWCMLPGISASEEFSVSTVPNSRLTDRLNHVTNPNHIISQEYVDSINYVLNAVEDSVGVEVAVVVINSINHDDPRLFATELFNHWGIGNKEEDNGLLILLVTKPEQRAVVFETGYGIEDILPDALCFHIQQKFMLPEMKEGNYSLGMFEGVKEVSKYLFKEEIYKGNSDDDGWIDGVDMFWIAVFLLIGLFCLIGYLFINVIIPLSILLLKNLLKKMFPKVCPECGKRSLKYNKSKIMRKATNKANGWGYDIYICTKCGHEEKEKFTIQKPERHSSYSSSSYKSSSSSSSSYDRDSGGGSWGGGSSGGGGSISRF